MIRSDFYIFLKKIPFFRIVISLIAGILFQSYFGFHHHLFVLCLLAGIGFTVCNFCIKDEKKLYQQRWIFGAGLSLLFFSLGFFLTGKADRNTQFPYLDENHVYVCKVQESPVEKKNSVSCRLQLLLNVDKEATMHEQVLVYLAKDSAALSLNINDSLLISTRFVQPATAKNPEEFDYGKYLKRKGIAATAYVAATNWQKLNEKPRYSLAYFSGQCQQKLLSIYNKMGVAGDEYAVLAALTLGYKEDLTQEIKNSFSASGTMHILAVSGLHVGVIYMVLNFLLSFLDKKRKTKVLKTILIVLFLWQYAFIAGLSSSVVRASFMFSLVSLASILQRKPQTYNTIFVSAFFMLLYNPYYLFDVGFQLSYIAVLSIIYFQPKFEGLIEINNRFLSSCWSLFCVSLAAQLGTMPLCLYYFHQFPNYFWLANMLMVPLSSVIIYMAVSLFFLYWVPFLGTLLALLLVWTVKVGNFIVTTIYHYFPYPVMSGIWLEEYQFLLLYAVIIAFSLAFVYKKYKLLMTALSGLAIFFGINFCFHYRSIVSKDKWLVLAMNNAYGILHITQNKSYLMSNNVEDSKRAMDYYLMKNRIGEPVLLENNQDGFCTFSGKNMLILSENIFKNKEAENVIELDYLVLTNKLNVSMEKILEFVAPKQIIVDLSYSQKMTAKIKADCEQLGINCFLIAEKGAYIAEF